MMSRRRDFIGMLAAAAGAATLTGPAMAATLPRSPKGLGVFADALVIETGLPTDAAFARGAMAKGSHRFLASADAYFDLVARLYERPRFDEGRGMPILALANPADSILIEQALRDSGGRLLERRSLRAPAQGDQLTWAHEVGFQLAGGGGAEQRLSFDGHPFIAIVAGF